MPGREPEEQVLHDHIVRLLCLEYHNYWKVGNRYVIEHFAETSAPAVTRPAGESAEHAG